MGDSHSIANKCSCGGYCTPGNELRAVGISFNLQDTVSNVGALTPFCR